MSARLKFVWFSCAFLAGSSVAAARAAEAEQNLPLRDAPRDVILLAQVQNPAGFQDPGVATPAASPAFGPSNTSTSPLYMPSAPFSGEVENNPALRQERRHAFGGGFDSGLPLEGSMELLRRQSVQRAADSGAGAATGKLGSDWRYAYYQGRHWYWTPANQWKVWINGTWVDYKPHMFQRPIFGQGTGVRGHRSTSVNTSIYGNTRPTMDPSEFEKLLAEYDAEHAPEKAGSNGKADMTTTAAKAAEAAVKLPNRGPPSPRVRQASASVPVQAKDATPPKREE